MLFETLYKNLCERGKNLKEQWEPVGSGLERHRILPEHQGGIYVDSNCTYLTLKEHTIAHYLLWRINGNVGDRDAYQMMSGINPNNWPTWLGRKHTPETKKKMSEGKKGKKHPNYGIPRSEETKKKISEGMTGEKNPNYGKTPSQETKKKISETKKGRKNPMYGRTGEKAPNSKKIKVIHLGIEKTYPYVGGAAKDLDICHQILSKLAQGTYKKSIKYPGLRAEYI